MRRAVALGVALGVGAVFIYTVVTDLPPFGSFPNRVIGENIENSIGQDFLEKAPTETGAANVVTSIVWGYRGYDTLGEGTILFTAVVGVIMVFRALERGK